MSETVMRKQIADYLNTGTEETPVYSFMGMGFNTLDESPNAQTDGKTYIHQSAQSSQIKSYQPQFAFDTDLMASDDAVMALYNIGRNQKTGASAELEYLRVELFRPIAEQTNTFEARKFKVAVAVSGVNGAGGEAVKVTGTLHGVGDFEKGTFNTTTKVFTLMV